MYRHSSIHITKVNNGWLVELPVFEDENPVSFESLKHEIFDDPALNRITNKANEKSLKKKMEEYKSKHLHIFKTFPEALTFLDNEINGK